MQGLNQRQFGWRMAPASLRPLWRTRARGSHIPAAGHAAGAVSGRQAQTDQRRA